MNKKIKLLFFTSLFLGLITNVKATSICSYEEQAKLNSAVANIKANYEEATAEVDKSQYGPAEYFENDPDTNTQNAEALDYNYFKVNILNLTNDFYAIITNDQNANTITVDYSKTSDGTYSFNWENLNSISNLTIKIYSSSATNCKNELYRTVYLTLPRYNEYYYSSYCTQYPNYYLCQKYVTYDFISYDEFLTKMNSYNDEQEKTTINNEKDKTFWEKIKLFIENNKTLFIISGTVIVIAAGTFTIITIAKRRKNK